MKARVENFFIRIPCERLAREAPLLARLQANPEVYIGAEALHELTPAAVKALATELAAFSAHTVHAPFLDVWPGAVDADVRRLSLEKMKKVMAIAAAWKSRLVVMHFNYDPIYHRLQFQKWLERCARFFQELLPDADGPLIALENIAEPTPYIALQLLKQIDRPRLVHCFDFGHHHVFGRIPFEEWLFYLNPQVHIHFHFHDNCGSSDDHLALGQGTIDWQAAKKAIRALDCPYSIALEPHAADVLRASAAYFRKHFF